MKVLHLLSNWKWTERAEPATDLAAAQQAQGVSVTFACGQAPEADGLSAADYVAARGIPCFSRKALKKHLNVLTLPWDIQAVRRLLADIKPSLVHCHMPHAHLLAVLARGRCPRPLVVRSCYAPDGPATGWRSSWLIRHHTDGVVVLGAHAAQRVTDRYGLNADRVLVSLPGIDMARFSAPAKGNDRAAFGLQPSDWVVGVVSRIRPERRLDIVLEAVARLLQTGASTLRLLVVGRGSPGAVARVLEDPARHLGIRDRMILAGYCSGAKLVSAYRSMDVLLYPCPGTDKSCRTIREAMASGVPVVGCRTGFIPDLVRDGETGFVVDLSPAAVADALRHLLLHPELLRTLKTCASEYAQAHFSAADHARRVIRFYETLIQSCP